MSNQLSGKVAIVTGASKGIGAEIARQLAADGAAVVVNYSSSKQDADRVVAEIKKAGGSAVAIQGNVSKRAEIDRLFSEFGKSFDRLDILVNNAGIYEFAPLEEITKEHFRKQYDVNVLGLLLVTQRAVKHMGTKGGSIINISSVASRSAPPQTAVYSGTKAAVDAITRSLSQELGARKIRVNSINPGMVQTEGLDTSGISKSEFRKQVEAEAPLGRIGQPRDIASMATFLASDGAAWITGENFYVSGGLR